VHANNGLKTAAMPFPVRRFPALVRSAAPASATGTPCATPRSRPHGDVATLTSSRRFYARETDRLLADVEVGDFFLRIAVGANDGARAMRRSPGRRR